METLNIIAGEVTEGGEGHPTHTRDATGENIYRAERAISRRMGGMNLRRDVRAGMRRRRRGVHGNPELRAGCPRPISIRFEGWGRVYSWPAAGSIPTDGRSPRVRSPLTRLRLSRYLPLVFRRTFVVTLFLQSRADSVLARPRRAAETQPVQAATTIRVYRDSRR